MLSAETVVNVVSLAEPPNLRLEVITPLKAIVSAVSLPKVVLPFAVNAPVTVKLPALVVALLAEPKVIVPEAAVPMLIV